MRIGFLFNHDQVHQVAHALPIAHALLAMGGRHEIVAATGNARLTDEVHRLSEAANARLPIVELRLRRPFTRLCAPLEPVLPVTKIGIYRDNLDFFRSLDALVVSEKTSLLLRTRYGLDGLKMIHTRHGAGDRAIGFDAGSARFDHVLVAGPKIRDRLIHESGVAADALSVVGYPKFDLFPPVPSRLPFAHPDRPTVLYNPHVSPHLSSWYVHGRAVLDHFLRDDRYNLIFAPHCMLFHRRVVLTIDRLRLDRPGSIARRYREAPNIHVDTGSRALTDMRYTNAADIYFGDASSQIYEYLARPRPCLFLNSHGVEWRGDPNYAHWQAGEVIGSPEQLDPALDRAIARHDRYREAQRTLFRASIALEAEPSSHRAARAVLAALGADRAASPLELAA
jgi:hypothetical protein